MDEVVGRLNPNRRCDWWVERVYFGTNHPLVIVNLILIRDIDHRGFHMGQVWAAWEVKA